ncbi:PepSY-associated TM helix domain-containing protein [Teredinibacter purpureus]|uniref:PepSY-associated TM helix domain-containing protein n=1 Tax=Teredinibacter purpureus TaxID=2731756 RepID=UPI0005F84E32|nr:PepSY-associated TM helix domain-containing protein [Teredinibacter purpureus]
MKTILNNPKSLLHWHNALGWWGLAAITIWVLSGAAHPIMSWLGPKAENFFPPSMTVDGQQLGRVTNLISTTGVLNNARVVKVVPSEKGPLLQVTTDDYAPRQYYSLASGNKLNNFDGEQAKWLASYYTGRPVSDIASIQFQTNFDDSYPWVNRLLPVYNVHFSGEDSLRIFIHTETSAMAGLNNELKASMQWFFQHAHTFKWLNGFEYGRLIIMSLFMLCLIGTAVLGLLLVFALKSRKIKSGSRRYHRWLGYVLWLPLLAWSASGFYHLLQSSLVDKPAGMRLNTPFNAPSMEALTPHVNLPESLSDHHINSISLVRDENALFYRLSISAASDVNVSRTQRYTGMPTEKRAVFIDATTGLISDAQNDQHYAQNLAANFAGISTDKVGASSMITRFGTGYDFRNKRLPVWKVEINDADNTWLFIDPITGILVDQSESIARVEEWSFTFLHKWNFLTPFTGRMVRDILIVVCLSFLLAISYFGAKLLLSRSRREKNTLNPSA